MDNVKVGTQEEIESSLDIVLGELKDTILNQLDEKQTKLLVYWLNDWNKIFLKEEKYFKNEKQNKLIKYERGHVVKAHLGYNVGSEQGGLHYGVVLDSDNAKSNNTVTIIPFRSFVEGQDDINNLKDNIEIYLGHELLNTKIKEVKIKRNKLYSRIKGFGDSNSNLKTQILELTKVDSPENKSKIEKFNKYIHQNNEKIIELRKGIKPLNKELENLKKGSIALPGQITTISKQRIYEPQRSNDILSKYRLDPENMKKIETSLKKLYLKE